MLLVLQRRGRTTASELAERLEVTQRTILRDVEVLSEAGVPIFTVRGSGGGIELMDGFQTHLTGLTTDEAGALFLVGQPLVAHRLGLGAPTRAAKNKLLNAMPTSLAEEADRLSDWFVHDPDPWQRNRIPHGELRRIARSIQRRRKIEITIGHERARTVRPLGLALKAGSWHLVTLADDAAAASGTTPTIDGVEVICIDALRATRLTNQVFVPPAGFDLTQFWTRYGMAIAPIVR